MSLILSILSGPLITAVQVGQSFRNLQFFITIQFIKYCKLIIELLVRFINWVGKLIVNFLQTISLSIESLRSNLAEEKNQLSLKCKTVQILFFAKITAHICTYIIVVILCLKLMLSKLTPPESRAFVRPKASFRIINACMSTYLSGTCSF